MSRRPPYGRRAVALLAATLALGACGGGGGGADDGASATPPPGAATPLTAAPAGDGAAAAVAALGALTPVDEDAVGRALGGYESFGAPHDPFRQQESPDPLPAPSEATGDAPAVAGDAPAATSPADPVPSVPMGGAPVTAPPVAMPAPPVVSPSAPVAAPVVPVAAPASGAGEPAAPTGTGALAAPPGGSAATPVADPAKRLDPPPFVRLVAELDVAGEAHAAREGQQVPPETRWFTVVVVREDLVVLRLASGVLPDGGDTVTLAPGESVELSAVDGSVRRITLIRVR